MVLGQLLEVMAQGAQQGCTAVRIVGLHQTYDLIVDDQPVRAVAVPVDASQIDIQSGMRQRLGQQIEQALAIHRLACGSHSALLGHPDQETTIDQCHTGAGSVLAKTAIRRGILRKIVTLHGVNLYR
jgi:hypothetical protein